MEFTKDLDSMAADVYRYMNFDQIESFQRAANATKVNAVQIDEVKIK
jgi:aconitate hydratase 2/2-methylisocitrate dehydratase